MGSGKESQKAARRSLRPVAEDRLLAVLDFLMGALAFGGAAVVRVLPAVPAHLKGRHFAGRGVRSGRSITVCSRSSRQKNASQDLSSRGLRGLDQVVDRGFLLRHHTLIFQLARI